MMDNLNLKPQSPDEVKTMMWNFRFTTEQSQYSRKLPEESYWQKTNL